MPLHIHRDTVIAHHLVVSGYGHWFANDVRGSGSRTIWAPKFEELGPIHPGRKRAQPTRAELRGFCREAEARLDHPVLWFDDAERALVGATIGQVIRSRNFTVWACAVLRDHVHLCVRVHRDDYVTMWEAITDTARIALRTTRPDLAVNPVWADRPYSRYLKSVADVWRVIRYVEGNPVKHGLPPQRSDFVQAYDNWPRHKTDGRSR